MFCNKNRLLLINNYSLKLLVCVFLLTDCKKVGADIAVYLVNSKRSLSSCGMSLNFARLIVTSHIISSSNHIKIPCAISFCRNL